MNNHMGLLPLFGHTWQDGLWKLPELPKLPVALFVTPMREDEKEEEPVCGSTIGTTGSFGRFGSRSRSETAGFEVFGLYLRFHTRRVKDRQIES
jgi:hypothetical protein